MGVAIAERVGGYRTGAGHGMAGPGVDRARDRAGCGLVDRGVPVPGLVLAGMPELFVPAVGIDARDRSFVRTGSALRVTRGRTLRAGGGRGGALEPVVRPARTVARVALVRAWSDATLASDGRGPPGLRPRAGSGPVASGDRRNLGLVAPEPRPSGARCRGRPARWTHHARRRGAIRAARLRHGLLRWAQPARTAPLAGGRRARPSARTGTGRAGVRLARAPRPARTGKARAAGRYRAVARRAGARGELLCREQLQGVPPPVRGGVTAVPAVGGGRCVRGPRSTDAPGTGAGGRPALGGLAGARDIRSEVRPGRLPGRIAACARGLHAR